MISLLFVCFDMRTFQRILYIFCYFNYRCLLWDSSTIKLACMVRFNICISYTQFSFWQMSEKANHNTHTHKNIIFKKKCDDYSLKYLGRSNIAIINNSLIIRSTHAISLIFVMEYANNVENNVCVCLLFLLFLHFFPICTRVSRLSPNN